MIFKRDSFSLVKVLFGTIYLIFCHTLFAEENIPALVQFKSEPNEYLEQQVVVEIGSQVSTPEILFEQDGYSFIYWSIGNGPITDTIGQPLLGASLTIEANLVVTAHYISKNEDSDSDGLPDWVEYRKFGNLSQTETGDPDSDGFNNESELSLGQEVNIADHVEDGGISFSASGSITYTDPSMVKVYISSDPPGLIESQTIFENLGSKKQPPTYMEKKMVTTSQTGR